MKNQHKYSSPQFLTWNQLRNYFSNMLTGKDMHDVEQQVQHDPFNRDAFDGFEPLAPASLENDLSFLKTRIERKTGYVAKNQIWTPKLLLRVAALVLIAVCSVTVIIMLTRSSQILTPQIAENRSQDKTTESQPVVPEHTTDENSESTEEEDSDVNSGLSLNRTSGSNATSMMEGTTQKPAPEKRMKTERQPDSTLFLTTLTPREAAVSYTDIAKSSKITDSDVASTTTLEMAPTLLSDSALPVILELDSEPTKKQDILIRGVASGVSSVGSSASSKPIIQTTLSQHEMSTTEQKKEVQNSVAATPPEPYPSYIKKIKDKIIAEYSDLSGEFEIRFTVTKDGALKNFNITKSISRRIDRRIIRIIQDSPNWHPAYKASVPIESEAALQLTF